MGKGRGFSRAARCERVRASAPEEAKRIPVNLRCGVAYILCLWLDQLRDEKQIRSGNEDLLKLNRRTWQCTHG